jgi:hypothetical protein
MARPLRIEYVGAVYHVMARGNHGQSTFADDQDHHLVTLGWPEAGDGTLQPGNAGRGPDEIQTGEETAGTQKAVPGGSRHTGMNNYVTFLGLTLSPARKLQALKRRLPAAADTPA